MTSGDWIVKQIKHLDEKNRTVYFTAGGKEAGNPYHDYLYKVGFDGKNIKNLTPDAGAHSISFSPSMDYFVDTSSTTTTPPVSVLRNSNGDKIIEL